jgi:type III pantothenate kinase
VVIAIDIGNSSMDFGVFEDEALVDRWRVAVDSTYTAERHKTLLVDSLIERQVGSPSGAIASSVVRGVTDELKVAIDSLWGLPLIVASEGMDLGIDVCVPSPKQVGIDRLLAASEAYRMVSGPVVVADLGTAITVDVVSMGGCYLGGTITAGLRQVVKALSIGTSLLPEAEVARPDSIIGTSTLDCIRAGVVFGAAGAVDRLASDLVEEAGGAAEVLLTGGDACFLSPYLSVAHRVEDGLVLRGLNQLLTKMGH